jgi:hypothetical protein
MKTTIEIPDDLLREAKEYAARHGLTLREVVVRGIRSIVKGSPQPRKFKLKTIAMGGSGMTEDLDWAAIRARIYLGQGG